MRKGAGGTERWKKESRLGKGERVGEGDRETERTRGRA